MKIECWVTEVRAASFTMAYEIFQDDGSAGDEPGERRVYLRATTLLTPYVFATERPRRLRPEERETLAGFLEPVESAPRPELTPARREKVGHYPVHVRFSDVDVYGHVNNVKYFEYFQEARILLTARLWRDLPEGTPPISIVVAQTDVDYRAPILFRAEPYDSWTWVSRVGDPVDDRRVGDPRRRDTALPARGWSSSSSTRRPSGRRRRRRSTASGCSP